MISQWGDRVRARQEDEGRDVQATHFHSTIVDCQAALKIP